MKIEVDINDADALKRLECELVASLDAVRLLLKKQSQNGSFTLAHSSLEEGGAPDRLVRQFIARQGRRFTSSDAFASSELGRLARGEIRGALARAVEDKLIIVTDPGKGRRPRAYEKQ